MVHGTMISEDADDDVGICWHIPWDPVLYAIYGNIYHQYTPNVSIYIWILWDIMLTFGIYGNIYHQYTMANIPQYTIHGSVMGMLAMSPPWMIIRCFLHRMPHKIATADGGRSQKRVP